MWPAGPSLPTPAIWKAPTATDRLPTVSKGLLQLFSALGEQTWTLELRPFYDKRTTDFRPVVNRERDGFCLIVPAQDTYNGWYALKPNQIKLNKPLFHPIHPYQPLHLIGRILGASDPSELINGQLIIGFLFVGSLRWVLFMGSSILFVAVFCMFFSSSLDGLIGRSLMA